MIYIYNLKKVTDTKYAVGSVHYMPFDSVYGLKRTTEELEKEGMLVENLPTEEIILGKNAIMYVNPLSKEVFYEYEDIKQENDLINRIALLEKALDDLLLNQGGTF